MRTKKKVPFHNPMTERLGKEFFATLPKGPGVYVMRSLGGEIIYVGKATNLRSRVSSYRRVAPGLGFGRNILKLVQNVASITWEEHASEERAYQRERELIRALVPRYNIADAWEEEYFFVGLRVSDKGRLEFRLTTDEDIVEDGWKLHGCYPHRALIKRGYGAMLRLLYAATSCNGARLAFPASISQRRPAYCYALKTSDAAKWMKEVSAFLNGRNRKFLGLILDSLLANELPEYTRPALQRDLDTLITFEAALVASQKVLSLPKGKMTSHEILRQAIRDSLDP